MAQPSGEKPLWNSLEVAKLVVGILTPLVLAVFGLWVNHTKDADAARREDRVRVEAQERERAVQVIQQRLALWPQISPLMNDLYCYFLYVGHWKELDPKQILATKRTLDKLMYSNRPIFTKEFLDYYNAFMRETFKTGNGWGQDAKLRSPPIRDLDKGKEAMFEMADGQYVDNTTEIHRAYYAWLERAALELDTTVTIPTKPQTPDAPTIRERLTR